MQIRRALSALLILAASAQADEPRLRLRSGPVPENLLQAGPGIAEAMRSVDPGRGHVLLQFTELPDERVRALLESRHITVLAYVPDNALLVNAPMDALEGLGAIYAGTLTAGNKLSPLLNGSSPDVIFTAVAELHVDVPSSEGKRLAATEGLVILDNPDMPPYAVLVRGSAQQLESFARHDETARVYPASGELIDGRPTAPCHGGAIALALNDGAGALPAAASLAASFGDGWDGPGLGAASLTYNIGKHSPVLDSALAHAEIVRAIVAWSSVVRVSFVESPHTQQKRQLDIEFADRAHGDGLDLDGRGGVLAHTFYPPPNIETVAGDLHFDIEEQWRIGNDVDVFSVALHEVGHALGLGHSDDPDAVMYSYYRRATMLHQPDVLEIRKLYATNETPTAPTTPTPPSVPPPPSGNDTRPPSLVITTPAVSAIATRNATYTVRGRASDDVKVTSVAWSSSNGNSDKALGSTSFAAGPIPLAIGQNRITIVASDAAGNTTSRSVTITRR